MFARPAAELAAREEIRTMLMSRGRASDAKDADAILRVHVPGSKDSHGMFDGSVEDFAEFLRTHNYVDQRYGVQRHTVSNILIDFDSATTARAESYHLAFHRIDLSSGSFDLFIGGRYLDRCQLHAGQWLLSDRQVLYDWSGSSPIAAPLTLEAG